MSTQFDNFEAALIAHGERGRSGYWTCPAHEDRNPSLSVSEGDKGIVFTCHAGCKREDIVAALGLKMSDTFYQELERQERYEHVADYIYTDEKNEPLYKVVRLYDHSEARKTFRQYRMTPTGWESGLKDVRRVPYKLPELLAATVAYFVEGEKDADTLRKTGLVSTTTGSAGSWKEEYRRYFSHLEEIIIIADNDLPGRSSARSVARSLSKTTGSRIRLMVSPFAKDVTEHLDAGHTIEELVDLPIDDDPLPEDIREYRGKEENNPYYARTLFTEEIDKLESPKYLVDGFIVRGELNALYGRPGGGKSFFAMSWAMCVQAGKSFFGRGIQEQGKVLYVAAESANSFKMRKLAWEEHVGATPPPKTGYWLPTPVNFTDPEAVKYFNEYVTDLQPILIVIDTLSRCIPGANENGSEAMTLAVDALQELCLIKSRPAVLIVHHDTKSTGELRGHGSLEGAVALATYCKLDDGVMKLKVTKNKSDTGASQDYYLKGVAVTGYEDRGAVILPMGQNEDQSEDASPIEIYMCIANDSVGAGLSPQYLAEHLQKSRSTINRILLTLQTQGKIVNVGNEHERRFCTREQAHSLRTA